MGCHCLPRLSLLLLSIGNRTERDDAYKALGTKQATQVQSLGQENPLEMEMATHSSILAWEIPWTEEPGGL